MYTTAILESSCFHTLCKSVQLSPVCIPEFLWKSCQNNQRKSNKKNNMH